MPLRNRHQRGERLLADDAQLIPKEGIEHKIRALLGGIDPFELARAHRLPHGQRVFRRTVAELHVADEPPEEPQIGGTQRGVAVQVQLCLRRDIDFVFLMPRDGFGQPFVQGVDALDHDGALRVGAHSGAFLAAAGLKIEIGERHRVARNEGKHIAVKALGVQTAKVLQVQVRLIPPLNPADLLFFAVIIVQRDHHRGHAA